MKKAFSILIAMLMLGAVCFGLVSCAQPQVDPTNDNYRVFYQIFVGSFSDSDGDGVGDIRGIINRMNYLNDGNINGGNDLGVQGIWLSPIFKSYSYHKYDTIDYYTIDPSFGTEEDLKELLDICHERNVKVILDLAINHTSNKCDWFVKYSAARRTNDVLNPYYDFYSTADRPLSGYNIISGSDGWYYECNFDSSMPELNYDNDDVKKAVVDVAKHWLDFGVDGFRFDAIKYIYFGDDIRSAAFWDWYMSQLKKIKPDIYAVGECWEYDTVTMNYFSALNCFNFTTSGANGDIADTAKKGYPSYFTSYVEKYQQRIRNENPEAMYCPFLTNHDMDRAAGFLFTEDGTAFMAANLYILCFGSPFIYYGEEIGMMGTRTPGSNTDANRRLAMLWGDKDKVENPSGASFNPDYQTNGTVKQQRNNQNSLMRHYANLIAMRIKYPEIARGTYTSVKSPDSNVGVFSITYNNSKIGLLHNVSKETVTIKLADIGFDTLCNFVGLGKVKLENGVLTIGPQTSVIVK